LGFENEKVKKSDVVVLKEDNWSVELLEKEEAALVLFYAPWCGHCKNLYPAFSKAATKIIEKNLTVKLAKIDATTNANLAKEFNVEGYPSLKWFPLGDKDNNKTVE